MHRHSHITQLHKKLFRVNQERSWENCSSSCLLGLTYTCTNTVAAGSYNVNSNAWHCLECDVQESIQALWMSVTLLIQQLISIDSWKNTPLNRLNYHRLNWKPMTSLQHHNCRDILLLILTCSCQELTEQVACHEHSSHYPILCSELYYYREHLHTHNVYRPYPILANIP